MPHFTWRRAVLGCAAMLAACHSPDAIDQTEINAVEAADATQQDADRRAERLEQAADALDRDGARIGGRAGRALQDQAAADRQAADGVVEQGERQAERLDNSAAGDGPRR